MGLTARSVQTALAEALAESIDITAQCLTYFNLTHTVSSGGSGRQGAAAQPSFAVTVWSRSAGEDDPERIIECSVMLSIVDESIVNTKKTVSIPGEEGEEPTIVETGLDTYGGPEKLETLLELAAAEVLSLSAEIIIADLTYSFEPLEYFPLFVGGLDFTVTYPVLIGGYEPTLS